MHPWFLLGQLTGLPDQFESVVERMIEKAGRAFRAVRHAEYEEDQEEFASDVSRLARVLRRISRIYSFESRSRGNSKVSLNKDGRLGYRA